MPRFRRDVAHRPTHVVIEVCDFGGAPCATHNMPCPVCQDYRAVLDMNRQIFQPCWDCQGHGYRITKAWTKRTLGEVFARLFRKDSQ